MRKQYGRQEGRGAQVGWRGNAQQALAADRQNAAHFAVG